MLKWNIGLLVVVLASAVNVRAVEFTESFDGPCAPSACGCGEGCGRTDETTYGFEGCRFQTHTEPTHPRWSRSTHQSSGGVNDSGCFRAVAEEVDNDCEATEGNQCHQATVSFSQPWALDGDLYIRGCWKFGPAWIEGQLADQKLYYIFFPERIIDEVNGYNTGYNVTIFWHAGSTEEDWSGEGLELSLYSVPGGWTHANAATNDVRHTNRLILAEHLNEWICLEVHEDLDQNPWHRAMWVTTERGAAELDPGTAGIIDGVMHFSQYEYGRESIETAVQTMLFVQYGSFLNERIPSGAEMWLDDFVLSDSPIGHPFGPGDDVSPAAPTGLTVF